MRRLTRRALFAAAVALAVAALASCGDDDEATGDGSALAERTFEAGEVTVKITPAKIEGGGASFEIAFDTHTVELDLDIVANAGLTVGGTEWPVAGWDGAGPGGHHREGTLRFDAAGASTGTAVLTIAGLAEPVEASWTLEGH